MDNNINCLIIDDDETSRFVLTNLANKLNGIRLIGACKSTKEAKKIMESKYVNLLFLDIEMPEETGVEFIKNLENPIDVIFITSQTKHAIAAFEYDAVDYIVKPVDLKRLQKSVNKAIRRNQKSYLNPVEEDYIVLTKNRKSSKYAVNTILYIEAKPSYVTYYTKFEKITTTGVLKKVEEDLDPNIFIRIHRSFIVNINKIDSISNNSVIMSGKILPLSRKYKKSVLENFKNK